MKKLFSMVLLLTILLSFLGGGYAAYDLWRHDFFVAPTYDHSAPDIPSLASTPKVLIFSKTNSYRHVEGIPAANAMFGDFAKELGWSCYFTENAAIHNEAQLAQFDLLVWNCVSGDVLTEEQRAAFKSWIESGGKILAIHASGGDPYYAWEWYPSEFIRAQFIGHPLLPQFQYAEVKVEAPEHPAMRHLPKAWKFKDELYSFAASPRGRVTVLASVNEDSYTPALAGPIGSLRMGDHPMIWHHSVGKGTVFYSAFGHRAEAYQDPEYRELLKQAAVWLLAGAK